MLSGLILKFGQTQGSRKLEPWAQISERLRRNFGQVSKWWRGSKSCV